MRQGRRSRGSLFGFVVVPAVVGFALLATAALAYHHQAAVNDGLAKYGVSTTAVISSTSVAGLGIAANGGGTPLYSKYAIMDFTANGSPESARVFLARCSAICTPNYQTGEKLLITYDSQNTANAVLGHYNPPPAPLSSAILLVAGFGLLALFVAAANLLLGT
jgi:hypothetical protein